ncbi:ATP-binding protein [Lutibacter sp.]|uniref:ATP-binding protein n=1 Tax=Lutibacter sp. TaxID=1925666 RepID=UPI0034A099A4
MNISSAIGKTVKEIYPDIEQSWIDRYGSTVINNKPIHFIDYNHNTNKTYSVNAHSFSKNKFAMFFEDITKLTISEKNLNNSEKQYEELFNSMVEMFQVIELVYDEDGNAIDYIYLKVNRAFEALVKKKKDELIGKRAKKIFGIVEDHWIKTYERIENTGKPENFENYGAELDKYYQVYAWKVATGQLGIVFTDITKAKKSEEALRKSEKQNKKYIQMLNEAQRLVKIGNWEWNIPTNEIKWSDTMFELLGYKPGSVEPSYELALNHVHPNDKEGYEKRLKESISNKAPYYFENRIVKKDTSVISVISKGIYFLDDHNNLVRMVGTVQDITNQKLIEKKFTEHQRLTALGEMAASIAHDFNNSLQAMMGNIEVAKLKLKLTDDTLQYFNAIGSIIIDISSRVKALQNFGNTESDIVNSELIDFNAIINESLIQFRPLWKDKMEKDGLNVNIITDFVNLPEIEGNKGELKTVIYNLISNSIEAMPYGGDITIKTGIKAESIFMNFTDTGIGMDNNTKLKLFQPFYTTKGFELGRGLGMSGVYSIVKKHGGDIAITFSELGKGTTIEIVLPISKKDDINEVRETTLNNKKSYKFLWVDDDATIRENGSDLLELLGHACDIANGGESALQHLNENLYDVVITDIGMPKMNGWQLADAIRKKFGKEIKIVVVSGWEIDEKTKNEQDVNFILQKPFTISEIEKIIMTL